MLVVLRRPDLMQFGCTKQTGTGIFAHLAGLHVLACITWSAQETLAALRAALAAAGVVRAAAYDQGAAKLHQGDVSETSFCTQPVRLPQVMFTLGEGFVMTPVPDAEEKVSTGPPLPVGQTQLSQFRPLMLHAEASLSQLVILSLHQCPLSLLSIGAGTGRAHSSARKEADS